MRGIAIVVAALGLSGAGQQVNGEEAPRYLFPPMVPREALEDPPAQQVTLEMRIVRRDLRSGKTTVLAQPHPTIRVGVCGSFLAGGEVAVLVPAGPGAVGVQFKEFGVRMDYRVAALTDVKTDLTETRQIRLEVDYSISEPREKESTKLRRKLIETIEMGRLVRHRLRRVEHGVEYLVEIRVKPADERRSSR
jgi:hypothetical protein